MVYVLGFLTALLLLVAFLLIGPLLLMLAWNYVMPLIWVGAPHLGFWHAFAICILLSFIKSVTYIKKD